MVELEKTRQVLSLYNTTLSTNYNIFISTYMQRQKAWQLYKRPKATSKWGKCNCISWPVKNCQWGGFRSIQYLWTCMTSLHRIPKTWSKRQCIIFFPMFELRTEFYVDNLQLLIVWGESVYNIFNSTKFIYAALVSICTIQTTYGRVSVNAQWCIHRMSTSACICELAATFLLHL